jgi:hypothetical protein
MSAPHLRSDFELIRFLAKTYDPLVARRWQDLPLIQLPRHALQLKEKPETQFEGLSHRPFEDMLIEVNPEELVIRDFERAHLQDRYWFRVQPANSYFGHIGQDHPWMSDTPLKNVMTDAPLGSTDNCIVIEVWATRDISEPHPRYPTPSPETTVIDLDTGQAMVLFTTLENARYQKLEPMKQQNWKQEHLRHVSMARALLFYLWITTEHLVVEAPLVSKPRPSPKQDRKPWTYLYLPRIILLDPHNIPQQIRDYDGPGKSGGSHASPRPHQRRAHIRTLRSPRYGTHVGQRIRVKEAWIGPREWILNGAVYRVL